MPESETLAATLARLETKLDTSLAGHTDHESRIRALEARVWQAVGAASILSAGLSLGVFTIITP
jgi:hypothetical protein